MDRQRITYLYEQYLAKTLSSTELEELRALVNTPDYQEQLEFIFDKIWEDTKGIHLYNIPQSTEQRIYSNIVDRHKPKIFKIMTLIAAAAAVAIVVVGVYFFNYKRDNNPTNEILAGNVVGPGAMGATLTLANGKKIKLSDALNGKIAEETGISVTKTADGQIVYNGSGVVSGNNNFNTLSTANGETYQVRLPDGSLVWLNAASSLTYPTTLNKQGVRKVKLKGEAYFEIAKDKQRAFIVESDRQEVEVLGTHFNIKSYADEGETKTTLLEGSVRIVANRHSNILKPGQQAAVSKEIHIVQANIEEVMAWKNGNFVFDDERLENVMNKIRRWYDVEVIYSDDTLKNELFAAVTTRFVDFSVLMKLLERSGGVKFHIDGRKVIVSRKNK